MSVSRSRHFSRREFILGASVVAASAAIGAGIYHARIPPTKKLGIALAGLGLYSTEELLPALKETRYAKLTGVVTRSPAKGLDWARKNGFPESSVYSLETMERLADNPDIDVVYVVTPNALHLEYVLKAVEAGKHVICEKPMAVSVAECDTMIEACRARKLALAIGYRMEYDPYHREMVRLAHDPTFGPYRYFTASYAFTMKDEQWRMQRELSGGGPLMDLGIYCFHGSCMAMGSLPSAITANYRPKTRPDFFKTVEEAIDWNMEFPTGATAKCWTSYAEGGCDLRAESLNGWIHLNPAFNYRGDKGRTSRGPLRFPEMRRQTAQIDAIAKAILDGVEIPVPGEMGRRDMVIMESIYKSADLGGKRIEPIYT